MCRGDWRGALFPPPFSKEGQRGIFVGAARPGLATGADFVEQSFRPAFSEMLIMAGWKACPTLCDPAITELSFPLARERLPPNKIPVDRSQKNGS